MFGPLAVKLMMTSPAASPAMEPWKVATLVPIAVPVMSPSATRVGTLGLLTSILNQWTAGTLEPIGFISAKPERKRLGGGRGGGSLVAGVEQEARPQLLGRVGTTLIDIAETDGAGGPERVGGRVVGLQRDDDPAAPGGVDPGTR